MTLFKNFLKILGVNILCSAVPWLHYGMLFGAPATLLSAVTITVIFRKELGA